MARIERTNEKYQRAKAKAAQTIEAWLKEQGGTESIKYDEETGEPYRCVTIDLTK